MEEILRMLLNRLEAIGKDYEELFDSDVRQKMSNAIMEGFVRAKPGFVLPREFGLFTPEANAAVRTALAEYIAAAVKEGNRWAITTDGVPSRDTFEMVWDPVFSPGGEHVLARAESGGRYWIVADGRKGGKHYDMLWDPAFSSDGRHVLLRYVEDDKYCRQVVAASDLVR